MNKQDLIARALRQLPYIEAAEPDVENDPAEALRKVRPVAPVTPGLESLEGADSGVSLLRSGMDAVKKVRAQGPKAKLTPQETLGLEAVIHVTGRPALLVQDNTFPDPPVGWEVLEDHRKGIDKVIPSVGVIDRIANGVSEQMGTGFLVAKNILMTNRHVAKTFAKQGDKGWVFMAGRSAKVDYRREKDRDATAEFRVKSILAVHDLVDMALLEVDVKPISGKARLPPPLTLAAKGLGNQEHVYVVGYPKLDVAGVTPGHVLTDIFGTDFGMKRLQPGEFDGEITKSNFSHDCSTLNGSSGSCVLSLEKHEVVGLHFAGTFEVRNEAVSLWLLQNDKMLKGRVQFAAAPATKGKPVKETAKPAPAKKAASTKSSTKKASTKKTSAKKASTRKSSTKTKKSSTKKGSGKKG